MSSNNAPDNEDGMRYRGGLGHHHHVDDNHNNTNGNKKNLPKNSSSASSSSNTLDFDISKQKKSTATHSNNNNSNPATEQKDDDDVEFSKPLLAHDYSADDESTNRGADSNNNANGDSSSQSTSLMTTISAIARKVRCKVLDKLPVSFATRFAVPAPPDHRIAALRRFLEHHVQHVATASAEEEGLTPRQKHHIEMIRALWDRLNSRAPRCIRRRAGEEDETICDKKLTGKIWNSFGFQGKDPATDFRGSGQLALEHMLYFVTKHPRTLEAIASTPADHAPVTAYYPFAVASINITMMLLDMIKTVVYAAPQQTPENTNTSTAYKPAVSASNFNNNSESSRYTGMGSSNSVNPASSSPLSPATPASPPPTPASTTSSNSSSSHSTTGNFHIGTYSAIEARRKLCHFLTDPGSVWHPPEPASSTIQNLNWTHKHFKNQLDSTMDELFGTAVGEAQHKTQEAARKATMSAEEQEMEQIAERLGAVYVACCVMLHDTWNAGKRNVMYFNSDFKTTAARTELLFRDSSSFAQVMNAVWKDY